MFRQAADPSALLLPTVLPDEVVSIKNAWIPVRVHAVPIPTAESLTIRLSVHVVQDSQATPTHLVDQYLSLVREAQNNRVAEMQ